MMYIPVGNERLGDEIRLHGNELSAAISEIKDFAGAATSHRV
jgi:hypothetical protein